MIMSCSSESLKPWGYLMHGFEMAIDGDILAGRPLAGSWREEAHVGNPSGSTKRGMDWDRSFPWRSRRRQRHGFGFTLDNTVDAISTHRTRADGINVGPSSMASDLVRPITATCGCIRRLPKPYWPAVDERL
jgi:hypothetical protein